MGPLARGLLFIQLAFYSNTSTPHPQCSGIRPNFGRDTKVQLKTPFSHLEHPIARGQGKGMRAEAKQVISSNKPSKSATRRAQELRTIFSKARGENFVTEGSREPSDVNPDPSGAGAGRIGSGTGVGSCPESAGPGPPVPALSGAAGHSWPQPPPRLTLSRAGLAPPHVPGPRALSCSAPPPPGSGRRADRDPVSAPGAAPHPSEAPALLPQWHGGSSPTLW